MDNVNFCKKEKPIKAFNGTLHSSNRQIQPSFGQKGSDTRKNIRTKKHINVNKFGDLYVTKARRNSQIQQIENDITYKQKESNIFFDKYNKIHISLFKKNKEIGQKQEEIKHICV